MKKPEDIQQLVSRYNVNNQSYTQQTQVSVEIPAALTDKINKIIKSIDGMYQFSGFNDQRKVSQYKTELTKGLYKIRNQIDESNLKDALELFRLKGGRFPPSVPEFIQAVLKQHEKQIKPPELKWFDPNKAISPYTSSQISEFGKQGVATVKAMLKQSKSASKK